MAYVEVTMIKRATTLLAARMSAACALALSVACFGCSGAAGNFVSVESKAQFQAMVLESQRPVMVEFYRDICPVCLIEKPKLSRISEVYADKMGFIKVSRRVTEVRQQYEVAFYPTVIVFNNGKAFRRSVGEQSQEVYAEMIDASLFAKALK